MSKLVVFSGNANPDLANKVVERLDIPLGEAVVGKFSDGEITIDIEENVRGKDVFILQPTCAPTNDNLMEDRMSTRLNSSHVRISYVVFCLKKKKKHKITA